MKPHQRSTTESGFVALFTVIFFALLSTVITIGFIRIMNLEQQQALNNDLTARALAAAEAGVEDAKRAIAHYANEPLAAKKLVYRTAFNNSNSQCDALFGSASPFVADDVINNSGGKVTSGQNLSYTCLSVDLNTADYISTVAANENHVIPLRADGTFDRVKLEWHLNSNQADADGDGIPENYQPSGSTLPTISQFSSSGEPPAYMRVQLIGVPAAGPITRDILEARSRAIFASPVAGSGNTSATFQTADTPGNSTNNYGFNTTKTLLPVDCDSTLVARGTNMGGYACDVSLVLPGGTLDPGVNDYYLQVTPLYRDTHIRASLYQGGTSNPNNQRDFREVQPRIDSNGEAGDTYRRIEVRASFPGLNFALPRYGAEVGGNVCKNFHVTTEPSQFGPNDCS